MIISNHARSAKMDLSRLVLTTLRGRLFPHTMLQRPINHSQQLSRARQNLCLQLTLLMRRIIPHQSST